MIPLIPPPSMLRMVIRLPKVGGCMGDVGVWISIRKTKVIQKGTRDIWIKKEGDCSVN